MGWSGGNANLTQQNLDTSFDPLLVSRIQGQLSLIGGD